jgi:hypothetical protein
MKRGGKGCPFDTCNTCEMRKPKPIREEGTEIRGAEELQQCFMCKGTKPLKEFRITVKHGTYSTICIQCKPTFYHSWQQNNKDPNLIRCSHCHLLKMPEGFEAMGN